MVSKNWSATPKSKSSPPPTARRRLGRSKRRWRSAAKAASNSGRNWSKTSTVKPVRDRKTEGCLPTCSRRRIMRASRAAAKTPGCSCHRIDTLYREEGLFKIPQGSPLAPLLGGYAGPRPGCCVGSQGLSAHVDRQADAGDAGEERHRSGHTLGHRAAPRGANRARLAQEQNPQADGDHAREPERQHPREVTR